MMECIEASSPPTSVCAALKCRQLGLLASARPPPGIAWHMGTTVCITTAVGCLLITILYYEVLRTIRIILVIAMDTRGIFYCRQTNQAMSAADPAASGDSHIIRMHVACLCSATMSAI